MTWLISSFSAHALGTVTVMADGSMSAAITELAKAYSRDKSVVVNTSFSSQEAQQKQITEGAAADILITTRQPWIEELKMRGLIDIYSQTLVAKNRLALVGPASGTIAVSLADGFPVATLTREFGEEPGLVIGNPETMIEGIYAKEALRNLGVASDLEPYTLYVRRFDQMIESITRHGMYGILFNSSAMGKAGLKVVDLLPEGAHSPVHYYAVVIAGDNMESARKFLDYLQTASARRILKNRGFETD